jgi:hypothetical protein
MTSETEAELSPASVESGRWASRRLRSLSPKVRPTLEAGPRVSVVVFSEPSVFASPVVQRRLLGLGLLLSQLLRVCGVDGDAAPGHCASLGA